MSGPQQPKVFISYARKDGSALAQHLHADLTAQGFDAWLDTGRIAGGASWTTEIEQALDACQVALALLTPGSYASEICRAEQLRALRKGKRVIPVLVQSGTDIPLHLETKNYRDFTDPDSFQQCFTQLLQDMQTGAAVEVKEQYLTTRVTYVTAPPTVVNYIERPEALRALRDALFTDEHRQPIALTALAGMGGIGKTVLAKALTEDEVVREAFPDGVVWITVGREWASDLVAIFHEVGKALGENWEQHNNLPACQNEYRTAMAKKAALVVVDDVWRKPDLDPFLAQSPRSRLLFTTRDASIGRFIGAEEYTAQLMEMEKSRELLAAWADSKPEDMPPVADELIVECGRLPLAVSLIGALLRKAGPEVWSDTLHLMRKADLTGIAEQLPPGQESFFKAVEVSFNALDPVMKERYKALAVLLEDMAAPLPVLQTLWNVREDQARRIGRCIADRSLAHQEAAGGSLRLHDLQLDYLGAQYGDREALELIRGALRLSSHVIDKDPMQFASQVVGRLLPHVQAQMPLPALQQFTSSVIGAALRPWLRPLSPSLWPPGGSLLRTLEGHSGGVTAVAVTPDGGQAISAFFEYTRVKALTVWDLKTGQPTRTLEGHGGGVTAVAVTPDGRQAISASEDGTLKAWDLKTGKAVQTLEGHTRGITAVAVTPEGGQVISGSWDETLKVWDLKAGKAVQTLGGHSGGVTAVAVTPEGGQAISAFYGQGTLAVWDLKTGKAVLALEGHSRGVTAVAVTPGGGQAISASEDRTLKVWDLKTGKAVRTLEGHGDVVRAVAVTPEGGEAVSASDDKTLKVWDLRTGKVMRTLLGHSGGVTAVTVTRDGAQVISASWDETLKLWDLRTGKVVLTPEGHSDGVNSVAVTPEGGRAISASDDKTLKIWDLKTGKVVRTLEGHIGPVMAVAVVAGGRRAISASVDRTLKVWNLKTGKAVRTLEGHSDVVHAVAVTPESGQAISASSDKTLKVWDLRMGEVVRTLEGHSDVVRAVAVTPEGGQAISASIDRTLNVWDLRTGKVVRTLEGDSGWVTAVAVTPEGRRAISASSDKTLKVWDLATGALVTTFTCDAGALCCAFADVRRIVTGDAGGRVHFLSLELKEES